MRAGRCYTLDLLLGAVLHRGKATGILQWTGDLVTLADRPSRGCSRQHAWVINVSGCLPLATAAGVGGGSQFACICLESEGNWTELQLGGAACLTYRCKGSTP